MTDLDVLESVQQYRDHIGEPDPGHVHEARRAFRAKLADAGSRPAPRLTSWRVRVPVMAVGGTALAAALTVGLVVVPGSGPTVDTAVAATLTAAADAAASQPAVPKLGEGQFWYEKQVSFQAASETLDSEMDDLNPQSRGTYEIWERFDGTTRIVSDDESSDEADMDETWTDQAFTLGTNVGGTLDEVAALPRDTDALYDHVEQVTRGMDGNDRPVNAQMFVLVRDLLREGLLPQDLREALYRVAARIPGVSVTPGVVDQLGRTGTAVWLVEGDTDSREEFIFDPATGAPLAERSLTPDGAVAYESAVVVRGVVDSIDSRL